MGEDPVPSPTVYVIAGPNGAGKTTFAISFLPGFVQCREFVNADLIAAGLSPFAPEKQEMRAARLFLSRVQELSEERQTFGFETTLAGRGYARLLSKVKHSGYEVIFFFLWLPDADVAVARVANRVRHGGPDIPEATIRRRFHAGLRHFFEIYAPLVTSWSLLDGSQLPQPTIASGFHEGLRIIDQDLYHKIQSQASGERDEQS